MVRIFREGQRYSAYFSDKKCGGKRKAKKMAQECYDKMVAEHGPANRKSCFNRVTNRNSTALSVFTSRRMSTIAGRENRTRRIAHHGLARTDHVPSWPSVGSDTVRLKLLSMRSMLESTSPPTAPQSSLPSKRKPSEPSRRRKKPPRLARRLSRADRYNWE